MSLDSRSNIVSVWIKWYFSEMPEEITQAWKNFLKFNFNFFSIPLLFKTILSPWRRYNWGYPRGFDPKEYLEIFISNSVSRVLGAIVRFFLILIGILTEILIFFFGSIIIFLWFSFPVLGIIGIVFALNLLF